MFTHACMIELSHPSFMWSKSNACHFAFERSRHYLALILKKMYLIMPFWLCYV